MEDGMMWRNEVKGKEERRKETLKREMRKQTRK
jgi:hypothetical protein